MKNTAYMTMKRIFKMKKNIMMIIAFFALLCGCSFENRVIPNDGVIIFSFPEGFGENVPYGEIPGFTLNFDGVIYTNVDASTVNKKVFSKNNDFYISDIIALFLDEHKDNTYYLVLSEGNETEIKMNELVTDKDGKLKHAPQSLNVAGKVFNEIAYVRLDNGLLFSLEYRRFDSDYSGRMKTYYTWQKTRPINMVLHYPLILHVNDEGKKELYIVPLPDNVIYSLGVGEQLPLQNILKDKAFLRDAYKTFPYPGMSADPRDGKEFNLEENIDTVKRFYMDGYSGRTENETFYFEFLEKKFLVTFADNYFMIKYSG